MSPNTYNIGYNDYLLCLRKV